VDWFTSGRAARGERWAFDRFQSRNEVWSAPVAAGILPAVEPGVPPGGMDVGVSKTFEISGDRPVGKMPPSTAGGTPATTQRIFLDSLLLDSADATLASPHRTGRFNCFALLLLIGEPLRQAAATLLETVSARPVIRNAALIASASPVRHGAILRVAGESVEQTGRELHHHLQFVSALLGDDPWVRKW
jgi:urease accessory protein